MIVMFLGYLLLALPTKMDTGLGLVIAALATIALGTGLFKGNLQALVGNLYDDPKYSSDAGQGVQYLLYGHQHRRHVRPDRLGEDQQLDPLLRPLSPTTRGSPPWPTTS